MIDKITAVTGDEILDSRGYPTLRVHVHLRSGRVASAEVPAGASTGSEEARELRDGDAHRYKGRGVLKAIKSLEEISAAIDGQDPIHQEYIDRLLISCDGTKSKTRLGANAIVGTSMAVARAGAMTAGVPLYAHLANEQPYKMPVPMMNIVNGGRHASNTLDFQEFMIVPHAAPSFREGLRWGTETYHALHDLLVERGLATGVGDEGGFAPALENNEEPCSLIVDAITRAGYIPGAQIAIALDPAASSFWKDGAYDFSRSGGGRLTYEALQALYVDWTNKYPIVSIEDGFDEQDWTAFRTQTAELGSRIQIVGDDLYVTNSDLITRGVTEKATNAVLIKLNQIGTVTETIGAIRSCRFAGWRYIISHRSGETGDTFIADFAVAMGGGQIKSGAPCRGERVAKYNRLLEIERELGDRAVYQSPFTSWAPTAVDHRSRISAPVDHAVSGNAWEAIRREVVAVIEEASSARRCLTVAERATHIAESLSLTALHICVDPEKLIAAPEEISIQHLRAFKEGNATVRLAEARQAFEQWSAAVGADKVKWVEHTGTGGIESSLLAEVKNAALIVIAQPDNLDSSDALHAALFSSSRPVLFVPPKAFMLPEFGRHMAIAWKTRPQAHRAVVQTLPWLRDADRISIISVNERDTVHDTAEVVQLLEGIGRTADVRHLETEHGEHVSDRILAEVEAIGADSIVMGAYRFGEIVEWAFGGVTREVLHKSRWPVFLMH